MIHEHAEVNANRPDAYRLVKRARQQMSDLLQHLQNDPVRWTIRHRLGSKSADVERIHDQLCVNGRLPGWAHSGVSGSNAGTADSNDVACRPCSKCGRLIKQEF